MCNNFSFHSLFSFALSGYYPINFLLNIFVRGINENFLFLY